MPKLVNHDERREQIAHAACQVVAKAGFENATVARIARAAGYTTGMVAHYFESKQQIILASLRLILHRIEQRLTQGERAGSDLLTVLSESLPIDETRLAECAFWTAFWGQVSADSRDAPRRQRPIPLPCASGKRDLKAGPPQASRKSDHPCGSTA